MQMHEDLASLFARNLSLQSRPYSDATTPNQVNQIVQPETAITYSITQHYHHSAHIALQKPSRPVSTPPPTDQETTEIILGRHGVDVTTLFPSQLELFKTADPSQQMRLVELWRISPPNYGGHALAQDLGTWPATSLQQEEAMAKLRYERQTLEERVSRAHMAEDQQGHFDAGEDMMSDGEQSNAPVTPIQGGDGRWAGATVISHITEPYMISGYESLAQREYDMSARRPSKDIYSHFGTVVGSASYNPSTDPVYNGHHHDVNDGWARRTQEEQQRAMEDQYGAFAQSHQYGSGVVVGGYGGDDEEML
jgi:hypothetical protein